jgi:hypothetical protein
MSVGDPQQVPSGRLATWGKAVDVVGGRVLSDGTLRGVVPADIAGVGTSGVVPSQVEDAASSQPARAGFDSPDLPLPCRGSDPVGVTRRRVHGVAPPGPALAPMRKDLTHDVEPPSPDERLRSARGQREGVELDGSRGARHTFLDLDRFVVSAHHDKTLLRGRTAR